MNTIQSEWESYKKEVISDYAGEIQISETKQAFYAGASVLMFFNLRIGDGDMSKDAGIQMMENLLLECEEFFYGVKKNAK